LLVAFSQACSDNQQRKAEQKYLENLQLGEKRLNQADLVSEEISAVKKSSTSRWAAGKTS
jgi:hypothetical protein